MSGSPPTDYAALLKRSLAAIDQLEGKLAAAERARSEPIAIVGIGCRFPAGADTPEAFWRLLHDGVDAVTEVPKARWDIERFYDPDPDAAGKTYTRWGAFLTDVDRFDAAFFGISPREAISMDPQQRLLLEVTWEALEHAGIAPASLGGSQTAVYVGITTRDYELELAETAGFRDGDAYTPSGTAHSVAAGRISYVLGLHGPNVAIDTACSSSLVALHWAAQSLRLGEADLALAGGVNLTLTVDGSVLTSRARMMAFDGRCKTFDASADGYVRGEGCGMLVLKRLSDARRDGDRILALVRGSALNQDGRSGGLTVPNGLAQEAVLRAALANARLQPGDIDYVEAHGTGTSLGDPIEVKGLNQVYGQRPAGRPLRIGSVKTNIGHLEAAAGIAGVIKTVLALQHRCVPPHLHLRDPNPLINWDAYPIVVPTSPAEWPARDDGVRRAAVSSFGFSGTNAHVVLEEAPVATSPAGPPAARLLVLSAQTPGALAELAGRYAAHLTQPSAPEWEDAVATAALGRSHLSERLALVADRAADAATQLASYAAGDAPVEVARGRVVGSTAPEVVFMFTGQGAQYAGMTRRLFDTEPVFRETLQECNRLLAPLLPRPLLEVLFATDEATVASLNDTAYTQPALFAVGYALSRLWGSWGVEPTAVLGHSVGEYVAACVAGVFSLEDGLRLIAERGRLMSSLPRDGGMVAIFADEARVRAVLGDLPGQLTIAAVNGPQNTVVSGPLEAIEGLLQRLAATGIEAQRLKVSHAFHSHLMDPILDRFEAVASTVQFAPPRIGLVSNVSGRLAGPEIATAAYWRRHVREAVRFGDSIATLQQDGYRVFIEVGPATTLIGMAQHVPAADPVHWIASLRKGRDDQVAMLEGLGQLHVLGQPVRWTAVLGADAARRRVTLPSYPFQRERFWHVLERRDAGMGLVSLRRPHPLLGGRFESAVPVFHGEIGPGLQTWLADHQIFEFTLFPATGFLELALAAAREALHDDAVQLRDLVIREGLRLPADGTVSVQVVATPGADESLALQVFSRDATDGEAAWRLHASATAVRGSPPPAPSDLSAMQRASTRPLDIPAYYERLAAQGAHYAAAFRGIVSIARSERASFARVRLDGGALTDAAAFLMHPALLDACFQAVGAGLPGADSATPADDDIFVPVGLAEYSVYRTGVTAAWCEVINQPADPGAELVRAELTLLDDTGAVLAQVRGLELRRTRRAALQRALGVAMPEWAYEVDWPATPLPETVTAPAPGRWLVFADAAGLGDAVARELEAAGDGVVRVRPGSAYDTDAATWQLDYEDPAQFRRLLTEAAERDARPLRGIVFLWPLDEAGRDADADVFASAHRRILSASVHLAQALVDANARLWFVTRGTQPIAGTLPDLAQAPAWGLAGVIAAELPALQCTRIDLDSVPREDEARALLDSLARPDAEDRVAWRGGVRHAARLVARPPAPPDDTPRRLEITERGTLENLSLRVVERHQPGRGEVEIRAHATGLNFRDVLNALGMYPGDPGPLGNECSGVISAVGDGVTDLQVGDDVLAMVDRSFATWVVAPAALVVRKPASLTHVEAATIPVTFLTAQYALHDLARIRKGDRVLIHAVTGGVGMAALQLARKAGAIVFGTAGSPAKRALALALGAQHVADSRSLSFEDDLRRATGGEGVDIVVNSLAGEFIPASLRLLARGGRFVEIGKTAIWDAARVAQEFPGVSYHPLYLGEVTATRPQFMRDMLRNLLVEFDAGRLTSLPRRCYPIERAEDAFRLMGQGQHTGKVVLTQPVPAPVRGDASYLVTGGLGGLGLACARGLVEAGARHLVLLGRHAPSPDAEAAIAALRTTGATVTVALADVADATRLGAVIAGIEPPLRGVLHAAGSTDDARLTELTPERFEAVMSPKVRGTWNLHVLTARCPLDFFVLYSAGAALLGSPGQGNYAAANSFMDALAHRRRGLGAPALSINWGSWSEVGMAAAADERHRRRWASMGLGMIAPEEGVRMLLALLAANRSAQVAALPLIPRQLPEHLSPFYGELLARRRQARSTGAAAAAAPVADLLAGLANARNGDRSRLLSAFLTEQVVKVLALGASHSVDPRRSLMELGMDSLMAMELRNRIQTGLQVRVAVADLLKGPSIETLSAELLAAVSQPAPTEPPALASETWEEGSL